MKPSKFYNESKFTQIYLEKGAKDYPMAGEILGRFPKAHVVEIDRFQEIFNRTRQNWRDTKFSQKIILAVKSAPFSYAASDVIQGAKTGSLFYTTPILNCLYDCDYCFLQGKFNSAHTVIFVNDGAFFEDTKKRLQTGPFTLCPSYETDLLGWHSITPWWQKWVEFASANPSLLLELRTKSGVVGPIKSVQPVPNVILSWSISPEEIITKYEKGTPSLDARLRAASVAMELGWKVRLCIDPVLIVEGWQEIYKLLIHKLKDLLNRRELRDIWIGSFRMNKEQLSRIKSQRDDSDILFYPFETSDSVASYPLPLREAVNQLFLENTNDLIAREKVVFW